MGRDRTFLTKHAVDPDLLRGLRCDSGGIRHGETAETLSSVEQVAMLTRVKAHRRLRVEVRSNLRRAWQGRAGLEVKREAGTAEAIEKEAPCKGKLSPHRETFSGSASMTAIKAHPAQVRVQVQVQVQVQGPDSKEDRGLVRGGFGCVDNRLGCGLWQRPGSRRDMMRLTHAMQGPTSVGRADCLTV